MLRCETFHAPALPPAEFERRMDGFIGDVMLVSAHVISDPTYPATSTMSALCQSIEHREFPDLHVLNRVVGWTLFMMQEHTRTRPLTDDETRIRAAAQRLSESLHGPRTH
jgi:hypothetical protein